ncbi:LysR family transcriptional regulator [Hansschlegelia plantiphila]|uniref:LysR family transcriptional regulator n=1 Tax=Hansschlegelia plantiphila TaxID=374655 RepID=A0A9W6IYS3_9HYPH|nr:LysR family transcriptional regulator [Hansschlegelia plantiphila]GLK67621.1 LysR family transcriptional regulator [Hansschlegelia plantiphila]
MDWDHLRILLAVARHGQLLAAARRLGLNHSTVARRLDALEAALCVALFDRRPTGCVLTQAGERLLPVAEKMEFELLGVAEAIRREEDDVSGAVRIGAPDGLGNYFLAAELGQLAWRHPNLVVELVPLPRAFSLSRREADLAIALDRPAEGRLTVSRLIDYSLSIYAAQAYLERHAAPSTVEQIRDHAVVTGVEDLAYASALDYSVALERHAGRTFRCASVMGQMEAVRAGAGIGVLHDFAARSVEGLVRILPSMRFNRSYFLLSHPDAAAIRRIAVLRDFVIRRFKEERRRFAPHD